MAEVGTWSGSGCGVDSEVIEMGRMTGERQPMTTQILESPKNFENMQYLTVQSEALTSLPSGCQIKRRMMCLPKFGKLGSDGGQSHPSWQSLRADSSLGRVGCFHAGQRLCRCIWGGV